MEKTERLQAGQKGEGCGLDGSKQKRQIREVFLMSDGGLTHQKGCSKHKETKRKNINRIEIDFLS